jgi:hypothetical protein
MTVELIVILGCLIPLLGFCVALFACELRIQYRDGDTRRFPRYGRSDAMRTGGQSKLNKDDTWLPDDKSMKP